MLAYTTWMIYGRLVESMKRLASSALVFTICVLCFCAGTAQTAPYPVLGDILKNTEMHYQRLNAFTAYFHQTTSSSAAGAMSRTEASGRLYYERPRQMRWEYEKPETQVFVANRQLAWFYAPSENQISMFDADAFFSSPLAQTFFEGVVELKNHFEVSIDPKQSNKAACVLKLIPRKEDPAIKTLFLRIDLQTYRITSVESHDALGNINRITLESQTAVSSLDPGLFQLDVPPATLVTDIDGRELTSAEIEALKQKIISR